MNAWSIKRQSHHKSYLQNNGAYSEADAARLIRDVASAIAFLHGVNVCHADLKPENVRARR